MINRLTQLWRLLVIYFVLARYGLWRQLLDSRLISPFSLLGLGLYANPLNWVKSKKYSRAEAMRLALQSLGPIFVKFGQALSTRADLLPEEVIEQLSLLQDKVKPFDSQIAISLIEQEYKKPLHACFAAFDPIPLASASVAQVHAATLLSGEKVIVKILRPQVKQIIARDVSLLYSIASVLGFFWKDAKRLRIRAVVREFDRTLNDELDLQREAASASQLKRNFAGSPLLHVPEVYWSLTREKILVQERIMGVPIADMAALKENKINLKVLAERGVEIFFTQVFRDCFFHADMHPGNIFVSTDDPQKPRYMAVDFGIMGSLNRRDQHYLSENFLAFFKRDYRRVAELHLESGWVPYETRVDEFEAAIRTVCEPIFEKPLKDISYGQVLLRLFQTGRRFNMEVQPQLVLLQKTLIAVEGLGRQLYPDLDLWHTAKPFLENFLKKRIGFKATLIKMRENLPYWLEKMPNMPGLIYDTLQTYREYQLQRNHGAYLQHDIRLHSSHHKKSTRFYIQMLLAIAIGFGLGLLWHKLS